MTLAVDRAVKPQHTHTHTHTNFCHFLPSPIRELQSELHRGLGPIRAHQDGLTTLTLISWAAMLKYRSNFGEVDVTPAKNDKVNKVEKLQKLTAGLNPNHMHIFKPWKKRCAKLHKDRHEII